MQSQFSRLLPRAVLATLFAVLFAGWPNFVHAQTKKLEDPKITIGLSTNDSTFLPIYLADIAGLFKAEGLQAEVVAFRGGSDLTRAVVAESIKIGVAAPTSVLSAIVAGEKAKVFYGGFNQAPFFWYGMPNIKTMADAKGKRFGITRFGSSTDALTRMALVEKGIDPKTGAQIVQGGGSAERLAAMESGQLDVSILSWPHNFIAADRGYNLLLSQSDLMPDFPIQSFFAMEPYINKNPETIKAVLRAFVKAVQLAKTDKELAVKTLVSKAGLEEKFAARAYDQLIGGWHEDGRLGSEVGLKRFFDMSISAGDVDSQWPKEKYFDERFVKTYDEWKPK
jgi:NitT/TauT family transport system substrate-binding protein